MKERSLLIKTIATDMYWLWENDRYINIDRNWYSMYKFCPEYILELLRGEFFFIICKIHTNKLTGMLTYFVNYGEFEIFNIMGFIEGKFGVVPDPYWDSDLIEYCDADGMLWFNNIPKDSKLYRYFMSYQYTVIYV